MQFKVFISSRNNDVVHINGIPGDPLTEIRKFIKVELESNQLLGQDFFEVKINEDFSSDASEDSYNTCLEEVRSSDFCIALYNGLAGWAPDGIDLGICHAEFDVSYSISPRRTAIIDISNYFSIESVDKKEIKRNQLFKDYLDQLNRFTNPLKLSAKDQTMDGFKRSLLKTVQKVIFKNVSARLKIANLYFNIDSDNRISLDWKKLKYEERNEEITKILLDLTNQNPEFNKFEINVLGIPDHMSVSDAKAFAGRPFLKDHEIITIPKKGKPKFGPIHFIGVYGNATETQVKNLIGFPDVSAMADDFGLYVWEQDTHIQLVLLSNSKTPSALRSKFWLFVNWCNSTDELAKIKNRARARYHILKAIIEGGDMASG